MSIPTRQYTEILGFKSDKQNTLTVRNASGISYQHGCVYLP